MWQSQVGDVTLNFMEIKSTANYPYVFVVYLKKGLQRQKERKREQIIQRKKLTRENLFDLSFSFLFFFQFHRSKNLRDDSVF